MEHLRSPRAPLEVSQDRWTHGCANFPNAPAPTPSPSVASLFMHLLCMCVPAPAAPLAPPATALIYRFRFASSLKPHDTCRRSQMAGCLPEMRTADNEALSAVQSSAALSRSASGCVIGRRGCCKHTHTRTQKQTHVWTAACKE